jgi:hypothetical protein
MHSGSVGEEVIAEMRARVEQCRRLARTTNDSRVAETLRQMANEGEADIAKLEAEEQNRSR